jgi:sugar lactone lactonase YvrE
MKRLRANRTTRCTHRRGAGQRISRRVFLVNAAVGAAAFCGACARNPSERVLAWGEHGRRDGHFVRPRAIGVHDGEVYVIDTSGRVQVFNPEGEFLRKWRLPEFENGTPTAVSFASERRVLIADTHYSRILEYTPSGELLRSWGSYGTGQEEFIYPTDIEEGPDGCYYVSEYGMGAQRVHVFSPDRSFLRQWGGHGTAPGQFRRAMALACGSEELYVCDTANHRIQVFSRDGELLRIIGEAGRDAGKLDFPYDVSLAHDGSLIASEYGTHRISRFAPDGTFIGAFGRPGRAPGGFNGPRGAACWTAPGGASWIFVADTDNHRIQRAPLDAAS